MEIVTKEQMDELDGLIEKYSNPEVFEAAVAGKTVLMCRSVDTSILLERKKNFITQEQCEKMVTAALDLLKVMPKTDFVNFLHENKGIFYFDIACFIRPDALRSLECCYTCPAGEIVENIRKGKRFERFWIISNIDVEEVIKTYTELTNFYKYIKKYPLTKDDVLNNISAKQNC